MRCGAHKLKFVVMAAIIVSALGLVVQHLWNWLLPDLFGWPTITFGKAAGLLVLSRILFGGFRGPGRHMARHHMMERWEGMTPEEREKFRTGLGKGCRFFGGADPDEKPGEKA